jgi:N-acetylglucosaminyldiphosphoundecaprenol N-acetyl-beta-D-mannosaminyltransferase
MQYEPITTFPVLDVDISVLTLERAIEHVKALLVSSKTGSLITFVNLHMVVEARADKQLHRMLKETNLNCPDGKPLAWIGRFLGHNKISQVSGPDFMPLLCEESRDLGSSHFLYGGAPGVAERAAAALSSSYPGIQIAGTYTPPFRPLTAQEDDLICQQINDSGADLVWVCLGCPKQERWMYEHRDRLNVKVLLGVGQALDVIAGIKKRAPVWMRRMGLEWLYRLSSEPGRLWKRYLTTNCLFVIWFLLDAAGLKARHSKFPTDIDE